MTASYASTWCRRAGPRRRFDPDSARTGWLLAGVPALTNGGYQRVVPVTVDSLAECLTMMLRNAEIATSGQGVAALFLAA